jgi:hypothetical protein
MDLKELAQRQSQFAARKVGHELVLVPLKGSVADMDEMFTLNETGSFIYAHLTSEQTVDGLVELMADEFDIAPEIAHYDILAFLEELQAFMLR